MNQSLTRRDGRFFLVATLVLRLGNDWGRRTLAAVSSCPANYPLGPGAQLALDLPPIRRSMAKIVVKVLSPARTVGVRLLNRVIH